MMNTRDEEKDRERERERIEGTSLRATIADMATILKFEFCVNHTARVFSLNFYTCLPYETPCLKIAEIGKKYQCWFVYIRTT